MATLTGRVKSMRVVEGTYEQGKRRGEKWEFLSMEVIDEDSGNIWSCQLSDKDDGYEQVSQQNLVKHQVRLVVMGQSAAERTMPNGEKKMQIRSQVSDVEDLGTARKSSAA
jgi:hypothetical protein